MNNNESNPEMENNNEEMENDMHEGPGQERHLPHEAWHVVQQKGRRRPKMEVSGEETEENEGDE